MRWMIVASLVIWVGATLALSELRWFARRPLADRLRPYGPGGMGPRHSRRGVLSIESFREVVGPLSQSIGERVGRVFGISEDLARRLARIHSPLDANSFRVRQLGWSVAGFGAGAVLAAGLGVTGEVAVLFLLGAPLLAFLLLEQQVQAASSRWQERVFLELPIVSEQIGMLLSAGYSLGGALNRVADRGRGSCAQDLQRVCGRIRQGLSEDQALREWADLAGVDAVEQLVQVLTLNRQGSDLGRLISEEARSIRREVQRRLVEQIERRSQQVWIPVTVATLVPGVIFLAVPFLDAMRLFTG